MKTKKVVSIKSEENIRKLPSQSDYTQQDAIEEFEELKRSYQKGIDSLQGTDYDKLPLALLLLKVEGQE